MLAAAMTSGSSRGELRRSVLVLMLGLTLGLSACHGPSPATAPGTETLWSGSPDLLSADISPDGRYLSQVNWASGNLQLLDLHSGKGHDLTDQGYDGGYAWTSAFAPDGRRIAVAWYVDSLNSHELRIIYLEGDSSRVLVPANPARYYVDPVDWSASGREILVAVQVADHTWQLCLVDASDGTVRVVKVLDWQTPGGGHDQSYPDADLSPDGRHVAYDYPLEPTAATRDIFMVPVDGGPVRTLVQGAGSDRLLGWLPDGSGILFYSDRTGTPTVWRLRVHDGEPWGDAEPIQSGVTALVPLGFTREGYAYGVIAEVERVHVAEPAPASGGASARRPVHQPPWVKSLAADWSPDGTWLAYVTQDPLPDPVEKLVIASVDGELRRTFPLTPALHTSNGTFRWTSEERLFVFAYQRGVDGIYEINLRDGGFRRIPVPTAIGRSAIKWFDVDPGGRTLFMVSRGDVVALDLASGGLRTIAAGGAVRASLAVSPDGTELAWLARNPASREVELRTVSTTGAGGERTVHRATGRRMGPPVTWTPDGSRIVFELAASDSVSDLWAVSARGGAEPTLVLRACCQENHVRIHPDGRFAFAGGRDLGEVRVLREY